MNMRVSVFLYLYRRLNMNANEADAAELMHSVWETNEIWRSFIDKVLSMMALYRQRAALAES